MGGRLDRKPEASENNEQRRVILPPPAQEAISVIPPRLDVPWLFYTQRGKRFTKNSLYYYWNPVRVLFRQPGLEFYELKHFGASFMLNELGIESKDVAVQAGHNDDGKLIRQVYGHPDHRLARERMKDAFRDYRGGARFS
jgi:integrase